MSDFRIVAASVPQNLLLRALAFPDLPGARLEIGEAVSAILGDPADALDPADLSGTRIRTGDDPEEPLIGLAFYEFTPAQGDAFLVAALERDTTSKVLLSRLGPGGDEIGAAGIPPGLYTVTEVAGPAGPFGLPNSAPDATDDAFAVSAGAETILDVLANDVDINGDTLTIATFTQPQNGTLRLSEGRLVYTPDPGFTGSDSFTYSVTDGVIGNAPAEAAVSLTVEMATRIAGGDGPDRLVGSAASEVFNGGGHTALGTGALLNPLSNFGPGQGWASQDLTPRLLGDIDGDGAADIVGFGGPRTFSALNDGSGGFGGIAGAVNNFAQAQGWRTQDGQTRLLGDVDGDGDDDIIGFGFNAGFAALSNGDGTFSGFDRAIGNFANAQGWRSDDSTPRAMADIDGDGVDDIVGFGFRGTLVSLGNGDGSYGPVTNAIANFGRDQGWRSNDAQLRLMGDVNGDGLADIIGFGFSATYTALSNGDGTFGNFQVAIRNFARDQGWGDNDATPRAVGDVNGDGIADIVGFGGPATFAALGVGDGTFGAIQRLSEDFDRSSGWKSLDALPRTLADMDGDRAADIVGFTRAGVLARESTGASDVFVFGDGFGTDVIEDFDVGLEGDRLDFSASTALDSLAAVRAAATQDGADTVITDGPDSLRLTGITLADLTAADFLFG